MNLKKVKITVLDLDLKGCVYKSFFTLTNGRLFF